jgi:malonyl-CoA O-methyltransferase
MRGLFVTGTDTGVGKTVLSAVLAASRKWGYWKPIQTGAESDTAEVARLASLPVHDRGVRLPEPLSPHLAARLAGTRIALADLPIPDGEWIVEGAGGVLVPINERQTMLDLMTMLRLPIVVAARTTLGTINHTLLTIHALRSRDLTIEKVVMIGEPNNENRAAIELYGRVPVDHLPWLNPLTPEAVRAHRL